MDIIISVAAKIAECAMAPIGQQMGYMFSYTHNFQNLANQLKELEGAKGNIERRVNVERRNGKEIKDFVLNWLREVDKITDEAKQLCEDQRREEAGCSRCSFPNLWQRRKLSRKAKKMSNKVVDVLRDGKKFERDKIGYVPPIAAAGFTSASTRFVGFESRMSKINEIMQALVDPKVSILGVYGLGGVGKTTLVEQVAEYARNKNWFDKVVKATVTKSPDLKNIQGEIADQLGLKFPEETVAGRALRLKERIKKEKNILILLDDIQSSVKLEEIGIPHGNN